MDIHHDLAVGCGLDHRHDSKDAAHPTPGQLTQLFSHLQTSDIEPVQALSTAEFQGA
jgi:hypothetical protein